MYSPGVIESPIHWSYAGFESREEFDREKCDEVQYSISVYNTCTLNVKYIDANLDNADNAITL